LEPQWSPFPEADLQGWVGALGSLGRPQRIILNNASSMPHLGEKQEIDTLRCLISQERL
jgi:hypothetical protein